MAQAGGVTSIPTVSTDANAVNGPATPGVSSFVQQFLPTAQAIGQKMGIAPELVLGQLGLETGWGKSIILGTNNLGNIKDTSGKGVSATDNQLGTTDKYRAYDSTDASAADYANLLSTRYQGTQNAGNDVGKFTSALKGYAQDPNYASKVAAAAQMVSKITGGQLTGGASSPAARGLPGTAPTTNPIDIAGAIATAKSGNTYQAPEALYTSDADSRAAAAPAPAPTPTPTDTGFFSNAVRGAKDFFPGLAADTGAIAALTGHVVQGWSNNQVGGDLQQWGLDTLEKYRGVIEKSAQSSDSLSGALGDDGSLKGWAGYTIGSAIPQIGQFVISSIAGAALGSAVGPGGTAAGALGGLISRKFVEQGVFDAAQKLGASVAEKAVIAGATKEAAAAAGSQAAQAMISKATNAAVGSVMGMVVPGMGQSIGSLYGQAKQVEAQTGQAPDLSKIIPAGMLEGALNAFGESKLIDRFLKAPTDAIASGYVKGAVKGSINQAATMGAIGAVNAGATNFATGQDIASNPAGYLDAIAGGVATGAVFGGLGGAWHGRGAPEATPAPSGPLGRAAQAGGLDHVNGAVTPDDAAAMQRAAMGMDPAGGNAVPTGEQQQAGADAARQAAADQAAQAQQQAAEAPPLYTPQDVTQAALARLKDLHGIAIDMHTQRSKSAQVNGTEPTPYPGNVMRILPEALYQEQAVLEKNLSNPLALSDILNMPMQGDPRQIPQLPSPDSPVQGAPMVVGADGQARPATQQDMATARANQADQTVMNPTVTVPPGMADVSNAQAARPQEPVRPSQTPAANPLEAGVDAAQPAHPQLTAPVAQPLLGAPAEKPLLEAPPQRAQLESPAKPTGGITVDSSGNARPTTAADRQAAAAGAARAEDLGQSPLRVPKDASGTAEAPARAPAEKEAPTQTGGAPEPGVAARGEPAAAASEQTPFEATHTLKNGKPVMLDDDGKAWVDKDGKRYPQKVVKTTPIEDVVDTQSAPAATEAPESAAKPAENASKTAKSESLAEKADTSSNVEVKNAEQPLDTASQAVADTRAAEDRAKKTQRQQVMDRAQQGVDQDSKRYLPPGLRPTGGVDVRNGKPVSKAEAARIDAAASKRDATFFKRGSDEELSHFQVDNLSKAEEAGLREKHGENVDIERDGKGAKITAMDDATAKSVRNDLNAAGHEFHPDQKVPPEVPHGTVERFPEDEAIHQRVKNDQLLNPDAVREHEGISYQRAVEAIDAAQDARHEADPAAIKELNDVVDRQKGKADAPRYEPFEEPAPDRVSPTARAQAEGRRLARAMGKVFNRPVEFFRNAKTNTDMPLDGVFLPSGKTLLEGDSDHPHQFVFGHELLHRISRSRPDLYAKIEKSVMDMGDYAKWAKDRGVDELDDGGREEFVADVVGKRMLEPEFWGELARRNPNKFLEIGRQMLRFIDKMLGQFRKQSNIDSYLQMKDIAQFRDTLAGVVDEFQNHVDGGGDAAKFRTKLTNESVQNVEDSAQGMIHEAAAQRALDTMPAPRSSAVKYFESTPPKLPFTGRKPTVYDVAKFFQSKNPKLDLSEPKAREAVAKTMTHEALYALTKDGNAVGWYDRKVRQALNIMGEKHPEILTDPAAREAFTAITAVMSNGQNVRDNFRMADRMYDEYKRTGRYPEDFSEGGKTNQAMVNSMKLLNAATDAMGHDQLMDFMMTNHPVREIEKIMGLPISGELRDTVVPGSVVLGPKIGSFFGNLNGHFDSVTMDKWFMRTVNRMRGGLLGIDPSKMSGYLDKVQALLPNVDTKGFDAQKIRDDIQKWRDLPEEKRRDPNAMEKQKNLFGFMKKTLQDYARGDGTASFTERTPINNLSRSFMQEATTPREAPNNGSDRAAIRDVMARTQRQLQKRGIDLSNADLQALLWYHEKDLYQRFGVGNELAKGFDYADAAREVADSARGQNGQPAAAGERARGESGRLPGQADRGANESLYEPSLPEAFASVDAAKFRNKDEDQPPTGTDPGPVQFGSRVRGSDGVLAEPYGSNKGADLAGAPGAVAVPGYGHVEFHAFGPAQRAAHDYAAEHGLEYRPEQRYVKVEPARAKRIADAFESMAHTPDDPVVKRAYQKMIDETLQQYQAIKKTGLELTPIDYETMGDPYAASPRLAVLDVVKNNHLYYFPTDAGFGGSESASIDISGNPLLAHTDEYVKGQRLRANDVFRIVHDYFGHVKNGVGFRADGEENAWRAHAAMYSDEARRAMTTETRGQNSWVNYGPFSEHNKTAKGGDTQYAPQKIGLLPDWVMNEGREDPVVEPQKASYGRTSPAEGATSVTGIHYGNRGGLAELSGDRFGTGIRGAEGERLTDADPDLRKRAYFYVREGDGLPDAETGTGPHVYQSALHNLYDPQSAPQEVATRIGGTGNAFERAVLDHGFDGYVDRGRGIAVLLNADKVPVDYLGLKEGAVAKPDVTQQSRALLSRELADVKERWGALQDAAPSARIKNGNLVFDSNDAPAVDRFLNRADGTGPLYRQKDMIRSTTDFINDMMKTQKKMSWWDRTVGTQYNKALKHEGFKKVFDRIQQQMKDRTIYAMQSEGLAPDVLPKLDSLSDLGRDMRRIWENKSLNALKKPDEQALSKLVYDGTLLNRVWTDADLDERGATPFQKKLYHQYLDSVNDSLETLGKSEMVKLMTHAGVPDDLAHRAMDMDLPQAAELARDYIGNTMKGDARDTFVARVDHIESNINRLKENGYVPLMRYGQYTVHVHDPMTQQTHWFSMYESEREANKAAREFAANPDNAGLKVDQGVMSEEAYKAMREISPESLSAFADADTISKDEFLQFWLKNMIANRSTLKRMIERKGTAGFDQDATRGLASFITSNSRKAADNLNREAILGHIESIPHGDVQDEATRLHNYVEQPQEEAHRLRGYMFASFLGGSVASAMNNMLQPVLMTYPYLSKYGAGAAAKELGSAMKVAAKVMFGGKHGLTGEIGDAVKRAEAEGVVKPHEIFQLMATARGATAGSKGLARAMKLWGGLFAMSEAFNRYATFIAAHNLASKAGDADPFASAEQAVGETQGIYNKGNRPNWARGAVGSTLFTFKQFTIGYLELLKRMDPKQRAMMLGLLAVGSGVNGMPFAQNIEDLIDAIAGKLGYAWNTEYEKQQLLNNMVGQAGANFVNHGVSAFLPFDMSGRIGVGDVVPGMGLLNPANEGNMLQTAARALGPVGGVATQLSDLYHAAPNDLGGMAQAVMPTALKNAAKALDIAQTGKLRDAAGRNISDASPGDAFLQSIGLTPALRKFGSESRANAQNMLDLQKTQKQHMLNQWAQSIADGDQDGAQSARENIAAWNRKNPDLPIRINPAQVMSLVKQKRMTADQRLSKKAPKELRAMVNQSLASGQDTAQDRANYAEDGDE